MSDIGNEEKLEDNESKESSDRDSLSVNPFNIEVRNSFSSEDKNPLEEHVPKKGVNDRLSRMNVAKNRYSTFDIPSVRVSQVFDRSFLKKALEEHSFQNRVGETSGSSTRSENVIPKHVRKHNEDITTEKWKNHSKHVFILSDAGKPIFTRYGSESDLNPMMAFFTTVLSHLSQDVLRTIYGNNNFKITFVSKGCINLICASRTTESSREIAIQLDRIYASMVFILTEKLQEFMKRKRSFDLRSLLGGTDACLLALISRMSNSMDFTIKCYSSMYVDKKLRSQLGERMSIYTNPKMLYSILFSGKQVIQVVRNRRREIHSEDLLLLMNFVNSQQSFRDNQAWTPLCLPGLTPVGYVYAYIDFISDDLCIVFINADSQSFFACSKIRDNLVRDWGILPNEDDLTASINDPNINRLFQSSQSNVIENVRFNDTIASVVSDNIDKESLNIEENENSKEVEETSEIDENKEVEEKKEEKEDTGEFEEIEKPVEEEGEEEVKEDIEEEEKTMETMKSNNTIGKKSPRKKVVKFLQDGIYARLLKSMQTRNQYPITLIPGIDSDEKVKHFLYKNEKSQAITQSMFGEPYHSCKKESKRIIRDYKRIREKITYSTAQFKLFFQVNEMENIIGWVSGGTELYVTFAPRVTKKEASQYCDKIKKWLKMEEQHLFLQEFTYK